MSESTEQTTAARRLRVLIIENSEATRESHADNVRRWGYEPVVVEGAGDDLLRNAVDLAQSRCCHLALVDKRLRDNYSASDTSGVDLIEKIKPTVAILVTGFADFESTEAAHQAGVFAVVAKKQGPEAVRTALDRAAQERWHPQTQIVWPGKWKAKRVAEKLLDQKQCSGGCDDEADFLVARLFPKAKKVLLSRLNGATKSDTPQRVGSFRQGSLLFIAYEDGRTPVIVKLSLRKKAKRERENYDEYIRGNVIGNRYAAMEASDTLWHLGGHIYRLIGTAGQEIQSFDDLYVQMDAQEAVRTAQDEELVAILKDFFETIWQRNSRQNHQTASSLFNLYDDNWNRKLSDNLPDWHKLSPILHKTKACPVSFPHPLRWLADNFDASHLPNIREAVVHGDLHGGNLMLDEHNFAWVIDYEDAGYGHVLRDYAELAQNIITRLYPVYPVSDDCLRGLYLLGTALAAPSQPYQRLSLTREIVNQPALARAGKVLHAIQRVADQQTGYQDSREFLWAILLDIAKVYAALVKDRKRQRRLLLLGGILCYRLDHWGDAEWPPKEWTAAVWK